MWALRSQTSSSSTQKPGEASYSAAHGTVGGGDGGIEGEEEVRIGRQRALVRLRRSTPESIRSGTQHRAQLSGTLRSAGSQTEQQANTMRARERVFGRAVCEAARVHLSLAHGEVEVPALIDAPWKRVTSERAHLEPHAWDLNLCSA